MILPSNISPSDRLLATLFLAGVIHAAAIVGISFNMPNPPKIKKSLEVTLIRNPSQRAPDKADFLAQENQRGGGPGKVKAQPKAQRLPQEGTSVKPAPPAPKPKPRPADVKPAPVMTQAQDEIAIATAKKVEREVKQSTPRLSPESLARQIAQLGAEINRSQANYAKRSRIKFINSVNAHKYKAVAYEKAWQDKVERIGNLNYPDEARRQKLSGSLVLSVGINHDGSIYSVKVRRSSGFQALDDAAKRIVRLASPYAPFPEGLREEADVLVITRTWQFTNDSLTATQ